MPIFPNRLPEPLFIPKLQSRFADFPYTRCLHTKGFSPRRPDAVISTARDQYVSTSFHGARNYAHNGLPRCVTPVHLHLELSSSAGVSSLGRYDDPAALIPRLEAAQCVTASNLDRWDLSQPPFHQLIFLSDSV